MYTGLVLLPCKTVFNSDFSYLVILFIFRKSSTKPSEIFLKVITHRYENSGLDPENCNSRALNSANSSDSQ